MSTFIDNGHWFYGPTRRSVRIAAKAPRPADPDVERLDVILAIADYCKQKGLQYSDSLLDEFDLWDQGSNNKNWYPGCSRTLVATWWAKYYSNSLFYQERMNKCHEAIYRYCAKRGIEYTPQMYVDFLRWYQDPANYALVNNVSDGHTWPAAPSMTVNCFFKATKQASRTTN